ncbi:MAG: hypothetical protein HOK06_07040 [Rhodospirillaceae bacterium]|jgi:seryl-tRNA synthetase|nr:hypothetical protein [Rhodospirillaceae bacterium]MBT4463808.1 hypothetical protein [Rhodospirillaceae bacterium]MBT5013003.1 hypothetical protein [Rhodospirillaceae bacterium]MBT5309540.1 hypothetical protein [Rhodospirillaceae bacterium]MBT6407343.1 hypothetical protein [Rhodospirillaceae bacterium]
MTETVLSIVPDMEVPDFLVREIQAKLAYVDEAITSARVSPGVEGIELSLNGPADKTTTERLSAKVNHLVEAMADGAFEPRLSVLEDYLDRPTSFAADPMDELYKSREVVREGSGYYILGPLLSALIDFFAERVVDAANQFGAKPYRFPALISPGYLERVKYFSNFPHSLSFVTHLREDMEVIEKFSEDGCCKDGLVHAADGSYGDPDAMLSPTVCHHLYMSLTDSVLPEEGLIATAEGNCFRYESTNMASLERLWNFTMREIIFVGSADFVGEGLEKARDMMRQTLDDMALAYKVESATDPFFIGNYRDQAAYQSAFELKHEVRALLPFKGDTIAVGSYNRHKDFFGRSLNIKQADGEFAETGCIGFGFERLAFAFICQHGFDPNSWPDAPSAHYRRLSEGWHSNNAPDYGDVPSF